MHSFGGGYGRVTGIRGGLGSHIECVVILDNMELYEKLARGMEPVYSGQFSGLPGFKFIAGNYLDFNLALGVIPPYPAAVVEAVNELYLFGVRNFIFITRAYRLSRIRSKPLDHSMPVIVKAAVPLDSVTRRVVAEGVPLLPSKELYLSYLEASSRVEPSGEVPPEAISVTVDSPRLPWSYHELERYIGLRNVATADSVSAPLYALQYNYKINSLSIVIAVRTLGPGMKTLDTDVERAINIEGEEIDIANKAFLAAVEALKIFKNRS